MLKSGNRAGSRERRREELKDEVVMNGGFGVIRSDGQFGLLAKCHLRNTFIPSLDNLSPSNNSLEWSP
jgi:hypothetical protein